MLMLERFPLLGTTGMKGRISGVILAGSGGRRVGALAEAGAFREGSAPIMPLASPLKSPQFLNPDVCKPSFLNFFLAAGPRLRLCLKGILQHAPHESRGPTGHLRCRATAPIAKLGLSGCAEMNRVSFLICWCTNGHSEEGEAKLAWVVETTNRTFLPLPGLRQAS